MWTKFIHKIKERHNSVELWFLQRLQQTVQLYKKKYKKPFMMSEISSDITEHPALNTNSAVPHIQGLGSIDP